MLLIDKQWFNTNFRGLIYKFIFIVGRSYTCNGVNEWLTVSHQGPGNPRESSLCVPRGKWSLLHLWALRPGTDHSVSVTPSFVTLWNLFGHWRPGSSRRRYRCHKEECVPKEVSVSRVTVPRHHGRRSFRVPSVNTSEHPRSGTPSKPRLGVFEYTLVLRRSLRQRLVSSEVLLRFGTP